MVEGVRECLVSDMFNLWTFRVILIEIASKARNTEERTGVIKLKSSARRWIIEAWLADEVEQGERRVQSSTVREAPFKGW